MVVHAHGSVWFSDPGYGILSDYEGRRADFELPTAVYRLDPDTGAATAVVTDLQRPNGLCFSPDETRLSVVDSGSKPGIIAGVRRDGRKARPWNGFRGHEPRRIGRHPVRCGRNLWAAAGGVGPGYNGVHVFHPDGTMIGRVELPEGCANLCLGGRRRTAS